MAEESSGAKTLADRPGGGEGGGGGGGGRRRASTKAQRIPRERSMSVFAAPRKSITLCRPFQREESRLEELARLQLSMMSGAEGGEGGRGASEEPDEGLMFPEFVGKVFFALDQTSWPRRWCLHAISSPYPLSRISYILLTQNNNILMINICNSMIINIILLSRMIEYVCQIIFYRMKHS